MADATLARRSRVNPAQVCKRFDELWARDGTYRQHCRDVAAVVLPNYKLIDTEQVEGTPLMDEVLDSTGIHALELLSATMAGALTPSEAPWFALKVRDDELNAHHEVQRWLEECERRMLLGLQQSNFYSEVGGCYRQLGAFGQFGLFADERQGGGLVFHAYAAGSWVHTEDDEGKVDTVMRLYKMRARTAQAKWGAERVGDKINQLVEQGKGDEQVEILHAVYPRANRNPKNTTALHMPWVCAYIHKATKHLILESGYHEFPVMVPRWHKIPGEVNGRGPGMTALPDLRTLNEAVALTLQSGQQALAPAGLVSNDANVGQLDMSPRAQNACDGDPRLAWVPFETGAKFDVSQILTEDLRNRIRHIFFWEQLQLQGNRLMTAFEVDQRMELMRRILGPELSRFQYEFLTALIDRVFGLMYRANLLPPAPDLLLQATDGNIDVEYQGPLARSQRVKAIEGMERFLMIVERAAAISPDAGVELLDLVNLDDMGRDSLDSLGVPAKAVRSEEEVRQRRQQRAQAQAQQRQLEQIALGAEAAGKAAPAVKALSEAAGGMNGASQMRGAA